MVKRQDHGRRVSTEHTTGIQSQHEDSESLTQYKHVSISQVGCSRRRSGGR